MPDFAFLHGGGQGGWVWDETIAALGEISGGDVRCLALDAPGCGTKRARDTSACDFSAIIDEILSDIEVAGLTDVVLVGHSQAGTVMPRLVEQRPDLFRRLIYVTCSSPLDGVTVPEMIGKGLHGQNPAEVGWPLDPATHSVEERYRVMFCNDMDRAQADAFLGQLGQDMWPISSYMERNWRYDHLATVPTSYVVCEQDMSLPPAWQETFAGRFHADRVVRLDAGHQAMNTQPAELADILLNEARA